MSSAGIIEEILAFKTLKKRGQAFVVFQNPLQANEAIRLFNGFIFAGKPLVIFYSLIFLRNFQKMHYSKTKSHKTALLDGTFVPKKKVIEKTHPLNVA
jgi:RNA recognition motif-containing protein